MPTGNAPVLAGARILLTARRRGDDLGAALEDRGASVVHAPTVACVDESPRRLRSHTREALGHPPDVVVVTTATAVERWRAVVAPAGLEPAVVELLSGARVLARGPKTRAALERLGVRPDWLGEAETTTGITDLLLADGLDGARVLVLHGGRHDADLEEVLRSGGADVAGLQPYRWVPLDDRSQVRSAARESAAGRFDAVLFTSAPGAHAWLRAVRREGRLDELRSRVEERHLLLAAVGAVTAEPLSFAGLLTRTPATARLADLVRLVLEELGDDRHALLTGHGLLRLRAGTVTLDHRPVPLSPGGLALMRRLASTPGHVVTREELLRVLPGASRDPHAAEVAVARLREALRGALHDGRPEDGAAGRAGADEDGGLVRTVVRRGYVLAAR
jgi:uroporphyrinogen-III synthase